MKLINGNKSVLIRKKEYSRIPHAPQRNCTSGEIDSCYSCGSPTGQLHVPGCDVEVCPRCRRHLSSCGCESLPNSALLPARRMQVQHLVRLGCEKEWAKQLNISEPRLEILARDPVEAEMYREQQDLNYRHRQERCNLGQKHKQLRDQQWRLYRQQILDEREQLAWTRAAKWLVDFA